MEPTKKEQKAIDALKKIAKTWPETLWLFSASGTLCVMRCLPDGSHATCDCDGMDQGYILDTIQGIDNDGGDW